MFTETLIDYHLHYVRLTLSLWLTKTNPTTTGITTITVPANRLQRKLAKEEVIDFNLFLHS